ncbi:hypothetical protein, partial [Cyanobium sp. Copco_Reservoir_LC18]|uniref:hypothetical protein n=1 Tax=Cyanobium sp. Copco_Reservoir_LC18 TaxID=1328305 RepID=UPI0019150F1E
TGLLYTAGARTINGVNLGSTQLGFAIRPAAGAPIQVSISGQLASASNPGAGWSPLAAAATAGGYDLYWRNSVSGQLARWNLNSSGAFVGGDVLTPNQFLQAESSLNADLDGDGSTGLLYTAGARTINGVNLGSTQLGFAIRPGAGAPIQVSISGQLASASNPGAGWSPLAAAATAGGYDLYWRNSVSGQLARWNLNSTGAFIGGSVLNIHQFLAEESRLNQDLDGDTLTGISRTSQIATVSLFSTTGGYALDANSLDPLLLVPITIQGNQISATNPGAGWTAIAAAADATGGFDLYWKNNNNGEYARWDLNTSAGFVGGSVLTLSQLFGEESRLAFDLNRDGVVGVVV